jgi:hypothetical protein
LRDPRVEAAENARLEQRMGEVCRALHVLQRLRNYPIMDG